MVISRERFLLVLVEGVELLGFAEKTGENKLFLRFRFYERQS